VTLAEHTRSSLVVDWLLRFHSVLVDRHPDAAEVATFQDHLRDYVRTAAPTREAELASAAR
jgi:hypothetical protein